ncbi:MAG: outer membrane beta-barrel protein [Saprospiraceae bacterium]
MKKTILSVFMIGLSSFAFQSTLWAQDNSNSVTIEVDKKVDQDVIAKIKMKTEEILNTKTTAFRISVEKYTAMQKAGEISDQEMERKIEQQAEIFEKEIKNDVENLEFVIRRELSKETGSIEIDMDELREMSGNRFNINIENGDDDDDHHGMEGMGMSGDTTGENHSFKIKLPKSKGDKKFIAGMTIAFGLNYLATDEPSVTAYYPEFKVGRSSYFEVGYLASSRLGAPGSHFYLNYGLSYNHINLDMDGKSIITHNDGEPVFIAAGPNVKDSELNISYLTIPLTLRLASKGIEGFGLEVGGYGGVRIGSNQVYSYKSIIDEDVEVRSKHRYGLNRFMAGVTGTVGWRWFNLFARYDLIPLFEDHDVYDYQTLTGGIRFNLQ